MSEPVIPEYPSNTLPTVFADGIVNLSNSNEVAKFYLFRFDPSTNTPSDHKPQVVTQVVMPLTSLVNMFTFLERSINNLVSNGTLTTESLAEARRVQEEAQA